MKKDFIVPISTYIYFFLYITGVKRKVVVGFVSSPKLL